MTIQKNYNEACNGFDAIYNIETAYLFQSIENAARLLDALQRVQAQTNEPRTIEDLREEFNLYEEK